MADPTDDPIWTAHEGCDGRIAELEADVTRLREALRGVLGFAETWAVEFYGDDGDLLTEEEDAAFVAARAALEGEPHG